MNNRSLTSFIMDESSSGFNTGETEVSDFGKKVIREIYMAIAGFTIKLFKSNNHYECSQAKNTLRLSYLLLLFLLFKELRGDVRILGTQKQSWKKQIDFFFCFTSSLFYF